MTKILILLIPTIYISAVVGDGGVIDTPDKNNKGTYKYKYRFINSRRMEEVGANK